MISLDEAQKLVLDNVVCLDRVELDIGEAVGYVLAEDIRAPFDVPSYRNSQMDGFAVVSSRTTNPPAVLPITHTLFAGDELPSDADSSGAMRVMTGAAVPDIFDAVIPFEDTEFDDTQVTIKRSVRPGENIRPPGDDLKSGEHIFSKGRCIRSLDPGLLASIGLKRIGVVRKPRMLILSSGDEVIQPGVPLEFGQVYDSNSFTIEAMTAPFRAKAEERKIVADQVAPLVDALRGDHDVVVVSGGVSMGERDYLPKAAESCGWHPLFHKVAVKPGKPIFVATRDRQILFGLPGNPLSAAVSCALFVIPTLKRIMGISAVFPSLMEASLSEPIVLSNDRTLVWPAKFEEVGGTLRAKLSPKRSSAALSALLDSDGLVLVSCNSAGDEPIVRASKWREIL